MKCPTIGGAADEPEPRPSDPPELLKKLKTVGLFLADPYWEDGTAKGDRIVMAFISRGTVRLLFKVEKQLLKFSVLGRSWDEAWAAAEMVLKSEQVPWEQDQHGGKGGGKKGK